MTAHIDTIAEWYKQAERITKTNLPNDGDAVIYPRFSSSGYIVENATRGWTADIVRPDEDCRILSRAPKPKPAWHDAVAVIAGPSDAREVYVQVNDGVWESSERVLYSDELTGATPLIEAKVTDEMVERARDYMSTNTGQTHTHKAIRGVLTAALGLETE